MSLILLLIALVILVLLLVGRIDIVSAAIAGLIVVVAYVVLVNYG